jgi:hypothetical protein
LLGGKQGEADEGVELSPLVLEELVKPAASLFFHRCCEYTEPVASIKALNSADTSPK